MNNYENMKNPPNFTRELKVVFFYLLDGIIFAGMIFLAYLMNNLFNPLLILKIINVFVALALGFVIVWRSSKSPRQRFFFVIVEMVFFTDLNCYQALDPNRKYHIDQY